MERRTSETRPPAPDRPPPRPSPQHAAVLRLQRRAGNQAVARVLAVARDVDLRHYVEQHPELDKPRARAQPPPPEHSSRHDATSYDSQPAALREVLERSFGEGAASWFSALSDTARANLVYTYNRMADYGIWPHVRAIKGVEAGERPVQLGPLELHVAGKSESVLFEVYDGRALRDTMLTSGHFGKDVGPSGALHPGQTSMREWSTTTPDGLHLSIGGGTAADAHIDKVSPTNRPHAQTSQMDVVRAIEHHWQEVWPEFIRKGPGWLVRVPQHVYDWLVDKFSYLGAGERFREALKSIPRPLWEAAAYAVDVATAGTTFKPAEKVEHPDPSQREKGTDFVTVKEYRFGDRGREARAPKPPPPAESSLDEGLTAAVSRSVEAALPGIVKPRGRGGDQGDYADTETVALAIAGKVLYQARAGGQSIQVDLGPGYHDLSKAEAKDVQGQLETVGRAAREGLIEALRARGDADLADRALEVRGASTQLGPSLVWFSLH